MQLCIFTLLLLLFNTVSVAQFKIKTITETNPHNHVDYRFPVITNNSLAARRINNYLQLRELKLIVGQQDSMLFERDWSTKYKHHGRQYFDFTILENTARLLAIEVSSEWCSAYCESGATYYVFDAINGNKIELPELFTEAGYDIYQKRVMAERELTLINEIIETYRYDEETQQAASAEGRSDYAESIKMDQEMHRQERKIYQDCLSDMKEYGYYGSFYISQQSIISTQGRCSAHVNQGLDNVGEFKNSLSIEKASPLLSAYGKRVLLGETNQATDQSLTGKVYQGIIGDKYPIKLILSDIDEDDAVQGCYAYEKTGKAIALSGKVEHDISFRLEERDEEENKTGTLSLLFAENYQRATGTWTSPDGKELSLKLFYQE